MCRWDWEGQESGCRGRPGVSSCHVCRLGAGWPPDRSPLGSQGAGAVWDGAAVREEGSLVGTPFPPLTQVDRGPWPPAWVGLPEL